MLMYVPMVQLNASKAEGNTTVQLNASVVGRRGPMQGRRGQGRKGEAKEAGIQRGQGPR